MSGAIPSRPVALVTGAARRIGRVIALRLARAGYAVILHFHQSRDEADVGRRDIEAAGGQAALVAGDLADAAACARIAREAAAPFGPVTLLVNNASLFEPDEATSFSTQSWDAHIDVNLRAPLILARDMALALPAGAEGCIVNILDQRVAKPTPHFFSYGLSKAGLHSATHVLAQALAPRIRVNAVAPGPTLSNQRQAAADFAKQSAGTILERPTSPEDVADAVLYLARARSVTGQTLFVDSGQRLAWRTPDVDGVAE